MKTTTVTATSFVSRPFSEYVAVILAVSAVISFLACWFVN
ncbi:hypothetical protein C7434_1573 [Pantoea sp. PNA 14-12]|uniref:Uncharacterized protein n=1 Tax=Pantoea stewartii subsp. stewartii DC283 TaxID=660596 RepID=H3RFI5_PANSE|nr:hypothetical protein CKS_1864 [Pantoea stewartii subsp. stewartii DC283]PXV77836.1 hypothetical protein C7433_10143 [Pantoea sp. PNA 03-3]TDS72747.1 hypothetical protein C7434_1573 [Pantoea sp. PNA 14-12]WHT00411.1 MAG: hypothetical protein LZT29_03478 [Pantoea stewartii]